MQHGTFYCGTSGLVLDVPNKQHLPGAYRDKPRLTYYASVFNSIEINSTFYRIPREATFSRWAAETPPAFRFTVKLWQGITHAGEPAAIERFLLAAKGLGEKKGCLLIQLPPSMRADKTGQLEHLLRCIVGSDPDREWKLAVEFRHNSWYTPATQTLLTHFQAALVLQDMPASRIWENRTPAAFVYLRYHGPAGDYKGGYPDTRLETDAKLIRQWLAAGRDVYAYFNNTIGDAFPNVRQLHAMVIDRSLPQPE
jgi:uncharacterized protein YecE (DUF72 family)